MLLAVSGTIIVANCLIGIFAPIMAGLDDEIAVLDTLWRIVAGQLIGIDYHTYGVGPYLVGTLLWHWLGPHSLLMRFSITLFCLAIAVCGCVVAKRNLPGRSDLALLFCLTWLSSCPRRPSIPTRPCCRSRDSTTGSSTVRWRYCSCRPSA